MNIRILSQKYVWSFEEIYNVFKVSGSSLERFDLFLNYCLVTGDSPSNLYSQLTSLQIKLKDFISEL